MLDIEGIADKVAVVEAVADAVTDDVMDGELLAEDEDVGVELMVEVDDEDIVAELLDVGVTEPVGDDVIDGLSDGIIASEEGAAVPEDVIDIVGIMVDSKEEDIEGSVLSIGSIEADGCAVIDGPSVNSPSSGDEAALTDGAGVSSAEEDEDVVGTDEGIDDEEGRGVSKEVGAADIDGSKDGMAVDVVVVNGDSERDGAGASLLDSVGAIDGVLGGV